MLLDDARNFDKMNKPCPAVVPGVAKSEPQRRYITNSVDTKNSEPKAHKHSSIVPCENNGIAESQPQGLSRSAAEEEAPKRPTQPSINLKTIDRATRASLQHVGMLHQLRYSFTNYKTAKRAQQATAPNSSGCSWRLIVHPVASSCTSTSSVTCQQEWKEKKTWDVIILFLVLYNAILLPLSLVFQEFGKSTEWVIVDYFVDFMFCLDVVINFRTAFIHAETFEYVVDSKRIAIHYMKTWFAVDMLSSLPLDLIVALLTGKSLLVGGAENGHLQIVSILKCIRLFRLHRVLRMFTKLQFSNVFGIIRLYTLILLFVHWMVCVWYYMQTWQLPRLDENEVNWYILADMDEKDLYSKYTTCFATVLLMLFRTQPLPMSTNGERGFLVFMSLIGAVLHATIFGQVAHLVSSLNERDSKFVNGMKSVVERMSYHGFPLVLRERIQRYYEIQWERHRAGVHKENIWDFVDNLSQPLRHEVLLFLHRQLVLKVPFFANCSINVVLLIIENLTNHLYMPGDYVVRCGDVGDSMYFIRRGTCDVLVPYKGGSEIYNASLDDDGVESHTNRMKRVKTLTTGDYFGEVSLLYREKRSATICCTTVCDLSRLKAEDLSKIVTSNPELAEQLKAGFSAYVTVVNPDDSLESNLRRADSLWSINAQAEPRRGSNTSASPGQAYDYDRVSHSTLLSPAQRDRSDTAPVPFVSSRRVLSGRTVLSAATAQSHKTLPPTQEEGSLEMHKHGKPAVAFLPSAAEEDNDDTVPMSSLPSPPTYPSTPASVHVVSQRRFSGSRPPRVHLMREPSVATLAAMSSTQTLRRERSNSVTSRLSSAGVPETARLRSVPSHLSLREYEDKDHSQLESLPQTDHDAAYASVPQESAHPSTSPKANAIDRTGPHASSSDNINTAELKAQMDRIESLLDTLVQQLPKTE